MTNRMVRSNEWMVRYLQFQTAFALVQENLPRRELEIGKVVDRAHDVLRQITEALEMIRLWRIDHARARDGSCFHVLRHWRDAFMPVESWIQRLEKNEMRVHKILKIIEKERAALTA